MDIPAHIQVALGIGTPATVDQLIAAFDGWSVSQSAFGLSTDDFSVAASEATSGAEDIAVSTLLRIPNNWKYIELFIDGSRECFGVCTPKANSSVPPTLAGQALVKAWFVDSKIVDDTFIGEGLLVSGLSAQAKKRDFSRRLIDTWADVCSFLEGSSVAPPWVTKNQIIILGGARILKLDPPRLGYDNLFLEAVSEIKAKWRYLSLYRILEHGYLSEVFNKLKANFFNSPKESLEGALASVESELKQFISLADTGTLQTEFEALFAKFENAKALPNKFAIAVARSIQQGGQLKQIQNRWQHGVLVCYKIRCAIVHAGSSSPLFDSYPDGSACIEMLLPSLESICLKFLGITVV